MNMNKNRLFICLLLCLVLLPLVNARATIFSLEKELRIDVVRIDPSPLVPGHSSDIILEVQNLKDQPLTNMDFRLTPDFPLTVENPTVTFPIIQPRESKEIRFKVTADPASQEGTYKLTLVHKVTSLDVSATAQLNVTVRRSTTLVSTTVETIPNRVEPGQEVIVRLTLRNTADSSLKDVSVRFDFANGSLPFVPVGSGGERVIKSLKAGEDEVVELRMLTSPTAAIDAYRFPVTIKFFDELGKQFSSSDVIGIVVDAVPKYNLGVEQRSVFTKSDQGRVSLGLSNTGSADMKFVTVTLLDDPAYTIVSKKNVYVGSIESDDSETVDFDVYINEVPENKVIPLKVRLQYRDAYNKEYGLEETIPMLMYTQGEAERLGLKEGASGTIFVVVIIILLVIGLIWWRKRKKMPVL